MHMQFLPWSVKDICDAYAAFAVKGCSRHGKFFLIFKATTFPQSPYVPFRKYCVVNSDRL